MEDGIRFEDAISIIVQLLSLGNYIEVAAAHAGISKVTLYEWLRRGARDAAAGLPDTPHAIFWAQVRKAEAEAEVAGLALLSRAAQDRTIAVGDETRLIPGAWQANAWRLERRHPERWGRACSRFSTSVALP